MAKYNDISILFPKTEINAKTVLDVWNAFTITEEFIKNSIAYTVYQVEGNETWSTIAHKIYGERRLWWAIALYNNVEDPFQLFYDNGVPQKIQEVRLLNQSYILDLIREINKRIETLDFESLDE